MARQFSARVRSHGHKMRTGRWMAAICILSLYLPGCSRGNDAQRARREMAVPVSVADVSTRTMPVQVRGIGTVEAYSTVSIKSQVNGELQKVYFREGQEVKKGSPLFQIDARPFESELQRMQANLARDTAQVRQAEANLARDIAQTKNAELERNRFAQLVERGVAARDTFERLSANADAMNASVRADQAAIENAQQAVRADNAAIENAKIQLGYCSIRSPIEGRTGSLMINEGNVVKANDVPLVVIHQVSPIYVNFAVPEQNLGAIRKYMAAGKLRVDAATAGEPSAPVQGVLEFVDNAVDSSTGTIHLKASFVNSERRLWPGQFVDAVLTLYSQPAAIVVPSQAVQTGQNGAYVFVVRQDMSAEMRPVRPGRTVGAETIIEGGLQAGEKVVTDGQLRLIPGSKIQIKPALELEEHRS